VAAFAISSFFSIRNPDHEERAKQIVRELTGHPVVCAHELSLDLGAFERATTAFFNAQLIPITGKFMETVEKDIQSRGINPRIFMLKCDGSVIGIKSALEKPIESIFSGPAGSLVGASFLTGKNTCAVIDVGGTSTDISVIRDGVPEISDEGAVVGGWKTRVKAIKMETSAMGGDSHIWVKDNKTHIGPRRAIPLSRAADLFPGFLDMLRVNRMPAKTLISNNIQPTTFFMKSGYEPLELTGPEQAVFEAISAGPTSLRELRTRLNNRNPSTKILDSLLRKRLIQPIGFTPTDALHVLGDYTENNTEAANLGAELLGSMCKQSAREFAADVRRQFARNMASNLVSFFLEGIPREDVRKIFDIDAPVKFRIDIPVVLIGGPVVAYRKDLEAILDAEVILPEHSDVGNAAGALAAKGVRRVDFLVRPASMAAPDWEYYVFSELGRVSFHEYQEAMQYTKDTGESLIMKYMEDAGLDPDHVNIDFIKEEIVPDGWEFPLQTHMRVIGVGTSLIEEEKT
jgi:N-methylhydantoinase A/oxoprolinase/acetone carboxylase beta subunit